MKKLLRDIEITGYLLTQVANFLENGKPEAREQLESILYTVNQDPDYDIVAAVVAGHPERVRELLDLGIKLPLGFPRPEPTPHQERGMSPASVKLPRKAKQQLTQ